MIWKAFTQQIRLSKWRPLSWNIFWLKAHKARLQIEACLYLEPPDRHIITFDVNVFFRHDESKSNNTHNSCELCKHNSKKRTRSVKFISLVLTVKKKMIGITLSYGCKKLCFFSNSTVINSNFASNFEWSKFVFHILENTIRLINPYSPLRLLWEVQKQCHCLSGPFIYFFFMKCNIWDTRIFLNLK